MINNFQQISELLEFNSPDEFYFLQIMQRKKEIPTLKSNSRVVKEFYINSVEYLLSKEQEIIGLCNLYNARAVIRLQPSSYEKSAFKTLINLSEILLQKKYGVVKNQYSRAIEVSKVGNPKWILDVDDKDLVVDTNLLKGSLIAKIPSKNGYHLITNPFDSRDFQIKYLKSIEIHRNNPTNLYIP